MNLRELLNRLQTADERSLDQIVLVSPPAGGYYSIRDVDFNYVWAAVIHFSRPSGLTERGKQLFGAVQPGKMNGQWSTPETTKKDGNGIDDRSEAISK